MKPATSVLLFYCFFEKAIIQLFLLSFNGAKKANEEDRTFQITKLSFCENITVIGFKVNLI